ncbi:hypothetical protein FIT61_00560 [Candidatus Methylopumilus rimovensis]|uniref:Porin n=1 Tax=Candidatus Methylopumilus rimovensis TaxID=2588535 RepID=A0AAE6KNZ0_9PROT|nr:TorF family putative porin [Candidatus Methylopumilus rimovensis]QDD12988.1 hypothetical protein FIT61_00560 [Candidatus Methylopumilus rimovensis]
MVKSLISLAVLGTLVTPVVYAAETTKTETKEESSWSMTTNMGFVSDYRARGVSQTWRKEAIQAGIDLTHSSGFYLGAFGSNVSPNTYPKANVELDLYAGYNGTVAAVEGLGYTAGVIGYFYPNGSWKKYNGVLDNVAAGGVEVQQTPNGGRWDTYEANAGISYKWLSAKGSVTLGDWYGAEQSTGWTKSTRGTTYLELNAAIPTPLNGLTLIGHVGRLNVNGQLDARYIDEAIPGTLIGNNLPSGPNASTSGALNPDYTDYKVGLSYAFKVLNADGWNAGLYYIGHNNDNYWGSRGYGGASFNGSIEAKNLNKDAAVFTLGRTF